MAIAKLFALHANSINSEIMYATGVVNNNLIKNFYENIIWCVQGMSQILVTHLLVN